MKNTPPPVFSIGLAMFAMFFGSGNLVFPLLVGQQSNGYLLLSMVGILLTGVAIPFLGVFAMALFDGKTDDFFGCLGRKTAFWFTFFALGIMGPFGVLARCIAIAYGAFHLIVPHCELWLFSAICCAFLFILSCTKHKIISLLGKVLTPILIASLGAIVLFVFFQGHSLPLIQNGSGWESFKNGVLEGYQTMDLLAAFFFSTFILNDIRRKSEKGLSLFLKSSLIGGALLSTIYVCLVFLGALFSPVLQTVPPQEMLGTIAHLTLGSHGCILVCLAIASACITTAVILTALFADFLHNDLSQARISYRVAVVLTLLIAYFVSNLEFSGIMRMIGPILEMIYPALIVFTILNICAKTWGWQYVRLPTGIVVALKLFSEIRG